MNVLGIAIFVVLGLASGHAVSFPSKFILKDPDTQGNEALGISFFNCRWNSDSRRLEGCPDSSAFAYGGVANFDVAGARLSEDTMQLIVPFSTAYLSAPPVCNVQLTGELYTTTIHMTRIATEQTQVKIYLFLSQGYPVPWAYASTALSVICFGPTTLQTFSEPQTGVDGQI